MLVAAFLSFAVVAGAPPPDPSPTELVVPPLAIEGAWLEVTLLSSDLPPRVTRLGDRRADDPERRLRPPLPGGMTMVCSGGRRLAVTCDQVYRGSATEISPPLEVAVRFERGVTVRGTYVLDGRPVAGARVGVVPSGLKALRAFTVPLAVRSHRAVREVLSDEDGRFTLPELAAGDYFLETVLPWGRIHRSEPFTVPDPEELRRERSVFASFLARLRAEQLRAESDSSPGSLEGGRSAPEEEEEPLSLDLGELDVTDGLVVELRVRDGEGRPIARAQVGATQGRLPRDVVSFEGLTNRTGVARLSGFVVDEPVLLTCQAPGYRPFRQRYDLVPVVVDCILERWAAVIGEVLGPGSQAVPGAAVSLRPAADEDAEATTVTADVTGTFVVGELAAGQWELTAAAPGFETERQSFELAPGQRLVLAPIFLLSGTELPVLVRDAGTEEPLAGVDVVAFSPPGAAAALTDLAGEAELTVARAEPLGLRFSTVGYASREVTVESEQIASGEPLVVDLEPAGWILAVVEDGGTGLPCQGCPVVIRPGGEELVTDGLGEALSGPLAAGYYRVMRPRITHLGSTVIEQPEAEYRHVRVKAGWVHKVRLGRRGRPLRVAFEPAPEGLWTLSARSLARSEKYYPQADGSYDVERPDGENVDLYLHHYDPDLGTEIEIRQQGVAASVEASKVVLPLPRTAIRGRAINAGGGVAGERVRLLSLVDGSLFATVRTDPEGYFAIPHALPGLYSLMVGQRSVHFVRVDAGARLELGTFDLAGGF